MAPSAPEPPPTSDARLRAAFAIDSDVLDVAVTDRVTRAGDLAVKSFGPEQIPRARLEAAVLSHLHQAAASNLLEEILGTGYRVPSIVRTRTDDDLHVDGRGALLATRWEAGVHRAWADIPLDGWWALGASLGALHRRLDEPGAPPPPERLGDRVRARSLRAERDQLVAHRADAARRDDPAAPATLRLLDARLRLLDARAVSELPAGCDGALIHNDYNQHNFLFSDDPRPLVLDWERAIGAPREYEVARCLAHLPAAWPTAARFFLDGYLTARPLDPAALVACVDVALTEHAVKHWPVARWLAGEPGAGARIEALAPVVEALADGGAALDAFYRSVTVSKRRC